MKNPSEIQVGITLNTNVYAGSEKEDGIGARVSGIFPLGQFVGQAGFSAEHHSGQQWYGVSETRYQLSGGIAWSFPGSHAGLGVTLTSWMTEQEVYERDYEYGPGFFVRIGTLFSIGNRLGIGITYQNDSKDTDNRRSSGNPAEWRLGISHKHTESWQSGLEYIRVEPWKGGDFTATGRNSYRMFSESRISEKVWIRGGMGYTTGGTWNNGDSYDSTQFTLGVTTHTKSKRNINVFIKCLRRVFDLYSDSSNETTSEDYFRYELGLGITFP